MRRCRTSLPAIGRIGVVALLVVALLVGGLLTASEVVSAAARTARASAPVIEYLEFDEAGVVAYADTIVADQAADVADPALQETTSLGADGIEINELFIRYLPDVGVADVFISLMLVGESGGCPSSMFTLNQTTGQPVLVDAAGSATATIEAQWTWDRQQLSGGVCFEKVVVARWTETYSIEMTFSEREANAVVTDANGVELLGSGPPATSADASGENDAAPPASASRDVGTRTDPAAASGETLVSEGADAEGADIDDAAEGAPGEDAPTSSGRGRTVLLGVALMIAVVLLLWAFSSGAPLRRMLTAVIRTIARSSRPEPVEPTTPTRPDLKTYGRGDEQVTYRTSVETAPPPTPPQQFEIMGWQQNGYRFVDAETSDGGQVHRLETGTAVDVLERTPTRTLVRPVSGGPPVWVRREDVQMKNPDQGPER